MEHFDILDISGKPTGSIACKGAPLQSGQYYLGVHAYIYNLNSEFLLQRRALDKAFLPGGWDIHMGHVVAGETSKEGIIRELHEELGLDCRENGIRFVGKIIWQAYHHMIDIYFLQIDYKTDELHLDSKEVIGVKTVSAVEMLALVSGMDYRPEEYRQTVSDEIRKLIDVV